jgi:phosphatidylinositol-4,5-bisphosphate 3-kinase
MSCTLQNISSRVSSARTATDKKNVLQTGLRSFTLLLPPVFSLPIDSTVKLSGIILEKCKYLDSNAAPLWLTFAYADKAVPDVYSVIVKSGDDLRQDILTIQMFSIMDSLWKAQGMDLGMTLYKVNCYI